MGNCLKKKGVIETYNSLKDIDAYFVTSGNKDVELPIPNLMLPFEEYRLLLASDIVITMSLFKEGWNHCQFMRPCYVELLLSEVEKVEWKNC